MTNSLPLIPWYGWFLFVGVLLGWVLLVLVIKKTKFRYWLFDGWIAQIIDWQFNIRSLRWFHWIVRFLRYSAIIAVLAWLGLVVYTCILFYPNPETFSFYLGCLALLFLLKLWLMWYYNMWVLSAHLRTVTFVALGNERMKNIWVPTLNGESKLSLILLLLGVTSACLFQGALLALIPFGSCIYNNHVVQNCSDGLIHDETWHVPLSWQFGFWNTILVLGSSCMCDAFVNARSDLLVEIQAKVAQYIMRYGLEANQRFDSILGCNTNDIATISRDRANSIWKGPAEDLVRRTIRVMKQVVTDENFFFNVNKDANSFATEDTNVSKDVFNIKPSDFRFLVDKYRRTVKIIGILCYGLSVLVLLGYVYSYYELTGSWIAGFDALAVICSDAIILVKLSPVSMLDLHVAPVNTLSSTVLNLLLLSFRIFLLCLPTNGWYIGQCCTYVLTCCFLIKMIQHDFYGGTNYISVPKERNFSFKQYLYYFCREITFVVISVYFVIITLLASSKLVPLSNSNIFVLNPTPANTKNGRMAITIFSDTIEDYKFGILAMMVVCNYFVINPLFVIPRDKFYTSKIIFIIAAMIFPVVAAWYISREIFKVTTEISLVSTVACFVPITFCGFYFHSLWVDEDFHFTRTVVDIPVGIRENEQLNDYYCALKKARKDAIWFNTKITILAVIIFCGFGLWGFGLWIEISNIPAVYCALLPLSLLSLAIGLLAAELWFNSLTISPQLIRLYVCHLGLMLSAFGLGFAEVFYNRGAPFYDFLDSLAFILLLTPVFAMGVTALRVLRDDSFIVSIPLVIVFLFCFAGAVALGSWVYIRFNVFALIVFIVVVYLLVNFAAIWVWWYYTSHFGAHSTRIRMVHMLAPMCLLMVILFIGSVINIVWARVHDHSLYDGSSGVFSDPYDGLTFLIMAYLCFVVVVVLFRKYKDRELLKDATCLIPSPCPTGIPVIAYKVEIRGGELMVQNFTTFLEFFLVICGVLMGYTISFVVDVNVGNTVATIILLIGIILSIYKSAKRYKLFRNNLCRMDVETIDTLFDLILRESVERCLQISQQAMMATWLAENKQDMVPRSSILSTAAWDLDITSVPELLLYYSNIRDNDKQFEGETRDSMKYEALFHVLVWMRTTQLVLKKEIKSPTKYGKKYAFSSNFRALVAENKIKVSSSQPKNTEKSVVESVQQIQVIHNAGEKYTDPDFPPTNGSLYIDWEDDDDFLQDMDEDEIRGAWWHRPDQMIPAYEAVVVKKDRDYDPKEVLQGEVGDCWLLSAMSVVALYPSLLDRVVVNKEVSVDGVYRIRLFLDGKWESIVIDDLFPCCLDRSFSEKHEILDEPPDVIANRYPLPMYCHTRSGNVLWPLLIEKAYAKRFGSYEALNGGHVHTALVDLTGGFSQLISLQEDVEIVYSGALWEKLVMLYKRGALLAAGSPSQDGNENVDQNITDENGIVCGHAYSIVRVEDEFDYHGSHKLILLRDPWGISRWSGPWSRFDTKNWTRRMQMRLDYKVDLPAELRKLQEAMGATFHDYNIVDEDETSYDGEFWISLEDFVVSFRWLYVCHLFDPLKWVQKSVRGVWSGESAGGPPNQPNAQYNPQYRFKLLSGRNKDKTVSLFISITNLQETSGSVNEMENELEHDSSDNGGRSYPFMNVLLLNIGGAKLCNELKAKSVVATSGKYKDSRDLSIETKIPYLDTIMYTIFPSLYRPGEVGSFLINVYCEADFVLEEIILTNDPSV